MSEYFYGVEIPEREIKSGYLSYGTFAKAFNHIMCNNIIDGMHNREFEFVCGSDHEEIFQYYIVDDNGAEIIERCLPNEMLIHDYDLDIYIWGISHFGTSWDYVDTDIKIEPQTHNLIFPKTNNEPDEK